MSQQVFRMTTQLKVGAWGEAVAKRWLVAQGFHVSDVRHDTYYQARDIDFIVDGYFVEVKTDKRADATGNLYLERAALEKSQAHVWIYIVPGRNWLFTFNHDDLLHYLHAALASGRTLRSVESQWSDKAGADGDDPARTWRAQGIPFLMSELMTELTTSVHTKIPIEEPCP